MKKWVLRAARILVAGVPMTLGAGMAFIFNDRECAVLMLRLLWDGYDAAHS